MFIGLGAAFEWTESGVWLAGVIAAVIGWGSVTSLGERLGIDRFWTGTGVLLTAVATPAWLFGAVFVVLWISCPEAGCFD